MDTVKPSMLLHFEPWQISDRVRPVLLSYLSDVSAPIEERLAAAEIGGAIPTIDDALAKALLAVAEDTGEPLELRRRAAISLGAALEEADLADPEDGLDAFDTPSVSTEVIGEITVSLERLFRDETEAKDMRRAALEAAIRFSMDWHEEAVREAIESDDRDWKLTGVFCARFRRGFEPEIVAALDSDDPSIELEAVQAAGNWGIEEAWAHIQEILRQNREGIVDRPLLVAAIEASALVAPEEARGELAELPDNDEEINEAIYDALRWADMGDLDVDGDDDDNDDDNDVW